MTDSIKFYKIKLVKKLLDRTEQARKVLFAELLDSATDPTIFKRRLRMIRHLNQYESQLIKKIEDFQTNDIEDLINFDPAQTFLDILNRSA